MNAKNTGLSNIKAILFDFGDTLVRIVPSREEIFLKSARQVALELSIEAVRKAYHIVDFSNKYSSLQIHSGIEKERFYQEFNEKLCMALGISSYYRKLQPILNNNFKRRKWQLTDDCLYVLSQLRDRSLSLAVVANWDKSLVTLTRNLGVYDYFSSIVASQSVGMEKPDPDIFLRALKDLPLSKSGGSILFVGNEYESDVIGARRAGLTPVLIDTRGLYPHADCYRYLSLKQWYNSWL